MASKSKSNSSNSSNSSKTMKALKKVTMAQRVFVSLIAALFMLLIVGVGYVVYLLIKFTIYKKREQFSPSVDPHREDDAILGRFLDANVHKGLHGVMGHFVGLLC